MRKTIRRNRHHYIAESGQSERLLRLVGMLGIITFTVVIIVCVSIAMKNRPSESPIVSNNSEYTELDPMPEQSLNEPDIEPTPQYPTGPFYNVLSVTDGDTIRIDYNGTSTPVRLIGVNTPETVDPRTTVQCFGEESSDYLKSILSGKQVSIESDPTQADRDKYNRLLRYVYLDGKDIGLQIIANGYGYEYTYNIPYQKQSEYKTAEKTAETNNLGLWSPSTCNGQH